MRVRAIADLSQLDDARLFGAIFEGLGHIVTNATRVAKAAQVLAEQKEVRGAQILTAVAEEEAAKYLILLDAVRCPRRPTGSLAKHLRKFNDHLAKGIYSNTCSWRVLTFRELRGHVDRERAQFYLDGPNDVDWIMRNWILQQREEAFYVDYVHNEEEGHAWLSPTRYDDVASSFFYTTEPAAVALVRDLDAAGCSTPGALRVIAGKWRSVELSDETDSREIQNLNLETLREMETRGSLSDCSSDIYSRIVRNWTFPLYSLEMGILTVDKSELREIQRNWYPE